MNTELKDALFAYLNAGLCALPATRARKCPVGSWKQFQTRRPNEQEIALMLDQHPEADAIAVICGKVSGNLEVIDFDWHGISVEDWGDKVESYGGAYDSLPIEETQNHGYHIFYRSMSPVESNQKLTWINFDEEDLNEVDGKKTFHGKEVLPGKDGKYGACTIETRGEGGLIICAPSNGYKMIRGSWLDVPTLDGSTIELYKKAARNLSTATLEPPKPKALPVTKKYTSEDTFSSADYLRETGASAEILARNGWSFVGLYNGNQNDELWRRPGKSSGVSAVRHADEGNVHIWTSSINEVQVNTSYSPLQLLAALEYNGDEKTASRAVFDVALKNGDVRPMENQILPSLMPEASEEVIKAAERSSKQSRQRAYVPLPETIKKYLRVRSNFLGPFCEQSIKDTGMEQPELAFAGALAALSYMTSAHIHSGSSRPNVNICLLAKTAAGKTNVSDHATAIAHNFIDDQEGMGYVTEGFESLQGAYDIYQEKGGLCFWNKDEFHSWLSGAVNGRNATRGEVVRELITGSFGKAHRPRRLNVSRTTRKLYKRNEDGGIDEKYICNFTMLAASQPSSMASFISNKDAAESGTISRVLFAVGREREEAMNKELFLNATQDHQALSEKERVFVNYWKGFRNHFGNCIMKNVNEGEEDGGDFAEFADPTAPQIEEGFYYDEEDGYNVPNVVTNLRQKLSDEYDMWLDIEKEAKASIGEGTAPHTFSTRLTQYKPVFQLLFACDKFSGPWGAQLNELVIDDECNDLAIELAKWFYNVECAIARSDEVQSSGEDDKLVKQCRKLVSKFVHEGDSTFCLTKSCFTTVFKDKKVRESLLANLLEAGVYTESTKQDPQKQRPVTYYEFNVAKLREYMK